MIIAGWAKQYVPLGKSQVTSTEETCTPNMVLTLTLRCWTSYSSFLHSQAVRVQYLPFLDFSYQSTWFMKREAYVRLEMTTMHPDELNRWHPAKVCVTGTVIEPPTYCPGKQLCSWLPVLLVVKNLNIEALMYFLLRQSLHTANTHATGKDTANTCTIISRLQDFTNQEK